MDETFTLNGEENVMVAVASSYKVCSKCSKQIKRKRFAEHFSICCPTKTCSEIFEEDTCGAKYETVKQHIKHCKYVEGKRHKLGTCELLYGEQPFNKWSCQKCSY